jgi:hypothetical protein
VNDVKLRTRLLADGQVLAYGRPVK